MATEVFTMSRDITVSVKECGNIVTFIVIQSTASMKIFISKIIHVAHCLATFARNFYINIFHIIVKYVKYVN